MTEQWVTLQQAAATLGVSESTIRRRRDAGELQSKQENGRYLIMVDATVTPNSARITPADAIVIKELRQQLTDKNQQIEDLKAQLVTKDQQIDKLQQALDQEQQLHAASQKTIESKQLQIEDMSRNRSILARIREVFIPSNI